MAQQVAYTADDGLRLVRYFGLELDLRENVVFRKRFAQLYGSGPRFDFITTCYEVYDSMPFFIAKEVEIPDEYVKMLYMSRSSAFGEALKRTDVREKLRSGIPLDEIIGD